MTVRQAGRWPVPFPFPSPFASTCCRPSLLIYLPERAGLDPIHPVTSLFDPGLDSPVSLDFQSPLPPTLSLLPPARARWPRPPIFRVFFRWPRSGRPWSCPSAARSACLFDRRSEMSWTSRHATFAVHIAVVSSAGGGTPDYDHVYVCSNLGRKGRHAKLGVRKDDNRQDDTDAFEPLLLHLGYCDCESRGSGELPLPQH